MSDSLSVLQSLKRKPLDNSNVRRILHRIDELHRNEKLVEFCWIPGHVGISGNERADTSAKGAAQRAEEHISLPFTDWYPIIHRLSMEKWTARWRETGQKMLAVKSEPGEWKCSDRLTRREEVVVNRLRSGHCRASHGHLMDATIQAAPQLCSYCNDATLTVKHVLIDCPRLENARRAAGMRDTAVLTLSSILGDGVSCARVLKFVKDVRFVELV